jgi:hypothetical protein
MPQEPNAVDTLIRDLGAAVTAAAFVRGAVDRALADQAISEAALAVNQTISFPGDRALLEGARVALQEAYQVIAALDEEVAHSRSLHDRSVILRGRAAELIEQARKERDEG